MNCTDSLKGTYVLDHPTHTSLGNRTTTKDLSSVGGGLLRRSGKVHLQKGDLASEVSGLLLVVHVAHLVSDVLEPVLAALDASDHSRKPETKVEHIEGSEKICAYLCRMTACEIKGLPNTFLWLAHFKHSSTI
jgi:hypothetical protein